MLLCLFYLSLCVLVCDCLVCVVCLFWEGGDVWLFVCLCFVCVRVLCLLFGLLAVDCFCVLVLLFGVCCVALFVYVSVYLFVSEHDCVCLCLNCV